jgi:hypothetical protein
MCRFIATLTACLAVTPPAVAQTASNNPYATTGQSSQPYPGMQVNPFDNGQLHRLPLPWIPPVPPVSANDLERSPSSQAMLNYILMYSGYYGGGYGGPDYSGGYGGYGMGSTYGNTQNSYGQYTTNQNTYTPEHSSHAQPLAAAAYPSHEPLLEGLANLKLAEVRPQAGSIINARAWMNGKELATLISSVNSNRQVYQNAERLTERLQVSRLLRPGDRVVGYSDGKVYAVIATR